MPYTAAQRKAIAAKMTREGKSRKQISDFFRKHKTTKKKTARRR